MSSLEVGGVIGSIVAGYAADRLVMNVCVIFCVFVKSNALYAVSLFSSLHNTAHSLDIIPAGITLAIFVEF